MVAHDLLTFMRLAALYGLAHCMMLFVRYAEEQKFFCKVSFIQG